jgi:hypothetical protein
MERAYLQVTPMGNFVIAYVEGQRPFDEVVGLMNASTLPIDRYFIDTVRELHGIDLTQPPGGPPPETIGEWVDDTVTTRRNGFAFATPLLPGVEDAGRRFVADAYHRTDMTHSRRDKHVNAEIATLAHTPNGEIVSVYVEADDPWAANRAFSESSDPFDMWFKGELGALFPPYIDLSQPVEGVTEIFDSQRQLQAI